MPKSRIYKSDVLIIGTGVAGLSTALYLDKSLSANIITKSSPENSSSFKAQGGIACVTDSSDSFKQHIKDTLIAGAGLCDEKVVEMVVEDAPGKIEDLKKWGVKFTGGNKAPDLGKEGGHSKRRILHHRDCTGEEMETKLINKVNSSSNIKMYAQHSAVNLIVEKNRCGGAYVLNNKTLKVKTFVAKVVVLATGGCGKVYLYTSNPDIATGDGIALAHRLGAKVANMEFIQFHPTCLYSSIEKSFLITEAMRGEGATLLNLQGKDFMKKYDRRGNLAPRDIVARAIDSEMKKAGVKYLYLDIHSYKTPKFIRNRFPSIYKKLKSIGIDITANNIPIVPAAHYCCGGIHVDEYGNTTIEGLMAVGECSHTGLHGANRLASNSLLEALVYGSRVAEKIPGYVKKTGFIKTKDWEYTGEKLPSEQGFMEYNWMALRWLMWNYVGVVRSDHRLQEAMKRIKIIEKEIDHYYWKYLVTPQLLEMRNLVEVSKIIIKSAVSRKESRGLHYNINYPGKLEKSGKNSYV
ncbi:L-aspartate oxidase [Elusimicrobiota bacterium]